MTPIEIVSWAYMLTNSARVLAYFPQIVSAWQCPPENARALSKATWGMFAVSHCTTTLYGWLVMQDAQFSAISLANFICTAVTFAVICRKQWQGARAAPVPALVGLLSAWRPAAETRQ
jgi:uncharacterized protein with PQ loop repeat